MESQLVSRPNYLLSYYGESKIFIEKVSGDRKPISILLRGNSDKLCRLSVIRAAVLLTILLDYTRRSKGLDALHDFDITIEEIAKKLSDDSLSLNKEQIRVAKYRLTQIWNREFKNVLNLEFDYESFILKSIADRSKPLQFLSSDPSILDLITNFLKESILMKLRREKSLFIPAGSSNSYELLNDLYSSADYLTVVSASTNISYTSLPLALLEKFALPDRAMNLYEQINHRVKTGKLSYTEIIDVSYFENLSLLGNKDIEYDNRLLLLIELIKKIENNSSYNLVITRAKISLIVSAFFGIQMDGVVFGRVGGEYGVQADSCYALWGDSARKSINEGYFCWILDHPNTIHQRDLVLEYLYGLYHHIIAESKTFCLL